MWQVYPTTPTPTTPGTTNPTAMDALATTLTRQFRSTNSASLNQVPKWMGESDSRLPNEYFEEVKRFLKFEARIDPDESEENRRELLAIVRNRLGTTALNDNFKNKWQEWMEREALAKRPPTWPTNNTVVRWLDECITVRMEVDAIYEQLLTEKQVKPGLPGYTGYKQSFNRLIRRLAPFNILESELSKNIHFIRGLHSSLRGPAGTLLYPATSKTLTLVQLQERLDERLLSKLREIPTSAPKRKIAWADYNKDFRRPARVAAMDVDYTEEAWNEWEHEDNPPEDDEEDQEVEEEEESHDEWYEERVAFASHGKGKGSKGGKGGKGGKGAGKGGKGSKGKGKGSRADRPRCEICGHTNHTKATSCYWSDQYEDHDGAFPRPPWVKFGDAEALRQALAFNTGN
jgi:hypothetical protein